MSNDISLTRNDFLSFLKKMSDQGTGFSACSYCGTYSRSASRDRNDKAEIHISSNDK